MLFQPLLLMAALLAASTAAGAQKVYRCGPDGREYSHMPCKEGRAVDVDDTRSPAQQREAHDVADSQRRLARQLEVDRRQREAAAKPQGAAGIQPAAVPEQAASAPGKPKSKTKSAAPTPQENSAPAPARVPPPAKKPAA